MGKITVELDFEVVDQIVIQELENMIKYLEGELEAFVTKSHWVHPDDVNFHKKDLKEAKRILARYTV